MLRRQVDSPTPNVGITALYRFSSNKDILYLAISTVAAIVAGAVQPLMTIIFGHLQGIFQEYFTGNHTYLEFVSNLNRLVVYFVYLGITSFVANYIATVGKSQPLQCLQPVVYARRCRLRTRAKLTICEQASYTWVSTSQEKSGPDIWTVAFDKM